ncbi:MAG TPA: NADH dehydrogenase (quinone) subunit D, partial [Bacteroidetes bacterium]|nr:NADH dehydrogenase (quinone) subunit D [Bacteroidota bacterium]
MAETKAAANTDIEHSAQPESIYDFVYDPHEERMLLNFGPSHPATHGTLRLVMELDGERIVSCVPELGYLHHGFEKLGEYRTYNQVVTITDRMNYISPMNNNFAYILAVEKLFGIEVSKRAKYFRVLLAEMSRIMDHLVCIGTWAMDLGAFTVLLYLFRERENLYNLFELLTGTRMTISYTRIGGFARDRDIPPGFFEKIKAFLPGLLKSIDEVEKLLSRNKIWLNRTKEVGVITREDALSYGITGPSLRASGIPFDLRVAQPYSDYQDFEFDIPVGETGDVYDRYIVRMEEMRQSVRIIEQAIDNFPGGELNVDPDTKVMLPRKDEVYGSIEGLIHHFEIIMLNRGTRAPVGEAYVATESPNGELGFYVVSNGGNGPYRF